METSHGLIVPGFKASPVGLVVSGDPSKEDWEEAGDTIASVYRASPWIIGDWYRLGASRRWGESYSDCEQRFGIKVNTAKQYVWVSTEFELSIRIDNLSHRHHVAVAAIADPVRMQLLEEALVNDWTVKQLEDEVKKRKPPRKKKEVIVCTPAQVNRAAQEALEIVNSFRDRLKKVGNNGMYTLESLAKAIGGKHEVATFVKQCEIAPHVEVHRTYGKKGLCQFQFVYSESLTHRERVRELAKRILDRADADTQSKLDANEIMLVTEV